MTGSRSGTLKDNGQDEVREHKLKVLCIVQVDFLGLMARSYPWQWLIVLGGLTWSGCGFLPLAPEMTADRTTEAEVEIAAADGESAPSTEAVADTHEDSTPPAESAPDSAPQPNYFNEGVNRAQSAVAIGQSAQSADDWNLAAGRWQQAVTYMQQVPNSDPNYTAAQQKVQEYGQNLTLAQRRAAGEVPPTNSAAAASDRPDGLVASIPVIEQMGGTPVVPVTLTGNKGSQQFPMLFDTGASATLITQAMANAIGVVITGSATVTVADGRQVTIPVGYVDTLQVGDLVVRDLWVGIGGDMALLGQDVYGEYGLSIGGSRIDLYE
jgi:predicted aspartyl protease